MVKNKKTNRDVVLLTATELFVTKGYLATSMDDIVAHSKVSKTNIYYHFKSKEELLSAIIDIFISKYEELITYILSQTHLSVLGKLEKLIHLLTENVQQYQFLGGCPFLTLYTQTSQESTIARSKISSFFQSQVHSLEQLLAEGVKNNQLKPDLPVEQTASLILSTIEGSLFLIQAADHREITYDVYSSLAYLLK